MAKKKNIEWTLSYHGEKFNAVKDKILKDMKDINSVMKKVYSNNCIIITITPTEHEDGEFKTEIHIYDNFLDANPLLEHKQKEGDCNVTVLQYNLVHDKFLFILLKDSETYNYKRIGKRSSQAMFNKFGMEPRIQFVYNTTETKVIIHKPM